MKKKNFSNLPPWRRRLDWVMATVDDLQRKFETVIGWRKKYHKYCTFSVYDRSEDELSLLISMIRYACPDLRGIDRINNPEDFGQLIRIEIEGERPKLKRVKIQKRGCPA